MESLKLVFWHWWVLAVVLASVEIFAPGAAFLWLGVAAACVGMVLVVFPDLGWQAQFGLFALLCIIAFAASRFIPRGKPGDTDEPGLNRRAEQYVGRTVVLESGVVNGRGRARVGDSLWTVSSTRDLPAGAAVRVVAADGVVLRVEPAGS
ncbi:NfeD family protein [Aerophototrophica crusticola]|uniref:NfeD family protein n=1 Tax=Aerophototrophica crusticola TaxID=1709002 RepID=A0A858R868_9PROT|nr:NfeD family protein [Rhodospirillaceae bacterium B3]